jgi:flagellar hook-length control protein FliK
MSTTPSISSKITSSRPDVEFGRDLKSSANMPAFDQVMNLVQPKVAHEAVKAYESNAQDRSKVDASSDKDVQRVDSENRDQVQETEQSHEPQEVAQNAQVAVAQQPESDVDGQRSKLLKMLSQLSQDDLLSIVEWRGDLNLQASALDTQLSLDNLPKVEGISTSDMMALLNGFKQLEIPTDQLPQLDGPQVANWLEAQWAAAKAGMANKHMMIGQLLPEMTQNQNMNVNQAALMSMEAVARPSEVLPALSLLKLSQSQKEGILRQVAQGYRNQRSGTQSVNIRLHPEELGAVRLKVEVQGQEVRLFFSAENVAVNDLISQNLDELRAMLLEKEFNLTEAGLFQEQLSQGEQQNAQDDGEDYGSDDRPNLQKRPKNSPKLSPLPGRFRATV